MDIRVRRTIERMEEQLHQRLVITDLAAAVELSVAQLTRIFREATGSTPGAYLYAMRMQRARILVERTSLSVTEVMAQVGVFDRGHFTRAFRRVHGICPRTLRVQLRSHGWPRLTCDEMCAMAPTLQSFEPERSTKSTDSNDKKP